MDALYRVGRDDARSDQTSTNEDTLYLSHFRWRSQIFADARTAIAIEQGPLTAIIVPEGALLAATTSNDFKR